MNAEATVLRERTHTRTRTGGASARSAKTQPGSGGVAFATQVMTVPLRAVTRPAGRRLAMATGLSLLLIAAVSGLYDHADGGAGTTPVAAHLSAPTAALAAKPASALASTAAASSASGSAGAAGIKAAEAAAVAWYAVQRHVPVERVQALQHRQVNAAQVQVLVMADTGTSGLYSDLVTVRRAGSGWKVP